MRKSLLTLLLLLTVGLSATAQQRTVQNRPYADLRRFHFGILVGTHLQDLELLNVGPQTVTYEDGTTEEVLVTCDQDRWDDGINVGVLGELRLSDHFQFRIAPAMYFGTRHLTFHNFKEPTEQNPYTERTQALKTAYITCALDLIFASQRLNNTRPYAMVGVNPMINLSGKDNDFLKLKRSDLYLEAGLGCDFYLQYFKLRPELKFMYSLTDCLDKNHINNIRDKSMLPYTSSVSEARGKMIVLTFYFE